MNHPSTTATTRRRCPLSALATVLALLGPTSTPAQLDPAATARGSGLPPQLAQHLTQLVARLPPTPRPGRELAHTVLARLRLGEPAVAASLLARGRALALAELTTAARDDEAAWLVTAHLWYWRTTADHAGVRATLPALTALAEAAADALPPTFAAAARQVLLRWNLATLWDEVASPSLPAGPGRWPATTAATAPGRRWAAAAVGCLLELERQSWQPGQGHFRPRLTAGALEPPAAFDPATLEPMRLGLLVATGDHMQRHLAGGLAALTAGAVAPACLDDALAAATQQRDDLARAQWARQALADSEPADPAARLDAWLHALTGIRLATGPGLDEGWSTLAPWLPPDCDRWQLDAVGLHGARWSLRCGREPGNALRLVVRGGSATAMAHTLVVQRAGQQWVHELPLGATFELQLPAGAPVPDAASRSAPLQPELQHDAPDTGRPR
jgi:hypothetical protein